MKPSSPHVDAAVQSIPTDRLAALEWDGDNREFIVHTLLPRMKLPADVLQVIRWAYGFDQSEMSYEQDADGSSVVADYFMGGLIKEPAGVGHDMLYRLHREGKRLPNGQRWGFWKCNWWYKRAMTAFGYPVRAWLRMVGLSIGGGPAWWGWWTNKAMKTS